MALERNLKAVVDYYHTRNMAVKGGHLLVKLINSVAINYADDLDRFYTIIDARAKFIANAFNFTNDTFEGKPFDGVFYGAGMTEYIISASERFEPKEAILNWKNQSPVKVVAHPKTDLECHLPNGMAYSKEVGVAVISINIPLLFVMYRGFVQEQVAALESGKEARTIANFVNTYLLPNMLESHLNLAIFNRCFQTLRGLQPVTQTARKHAIALENSTAIIDTALSETLKYLTKTELTLEAMLLCVPAINGGNGMQTMKLPEVAPTYQYAWIEIVSRIPYLVMLMLASPSGLKAYSKVDLLHISRIVSYDGLKPIMTRMLPRSEVKEYQDMLEAVITAAKAA